MQFTIDPWSNTIATGTEDGKLIVYDTHSFDQIYEDKISNHCINSLSFHPYSAMLIATSGQRNFDLLDIDSDSSEYIGTEGAQKTTDGLEKWSELQTYLLYKNNVVLQQLRAAYKN